MNRCYIIGGGPSITETNLSLLRDKFVIGVNMAYKLGNWVNVWFFADSNIYKNNKEAIQKWPNRIVSCAGAAKRNKKIEYYQRCKKHWICFEPDKLAFPSPGANSGATAINLAIREGFDSVVLVGFDMKMENGKHHYHNYYKKEPRDDIYDRFMLHFKHIAEETKIEIINANPDSALPFFPKIKLEDL